MNYDFLNEVKEQVGEIIKIDEPMKFHTTFQVGGPADYFVSPRSEEEIRILLDKAKKYEIPVFIVGNGSNLLVSDKGYRGMIVQIGKEFSDVAVDDKCKSSISLIDMEARREASSESNGGEMISAQAGASLAKIARTAYEKGLGGFEFAAGIPGTLGGAVSMNAGAYGGEIKDVIVDARVLTKEGEILTVKADELELAYRSSIITKKDYIVLGARFYFEKKDKQEIKARMDELALARKSKQPLEFPSAGSTFKRPEGYFAGKLIMDAGLRGFQVGGARVSDKHCGFVINAGDATAADIYSLILQVQEKVQKQFNVTLQPEVKMLGEF